MANILLMFSFAHQPQIRWNAVCADRRGGELFVFTVMKSVGDEINFRVISFRQLNSLL